MTISSYNDSFFRFFFDNDTFDLRKDLGKVMPDGCEDADVEMEIALASLNEFVKAGILKRIAVSGGYLFVLRQPLASYSQTLTLDAKTIGGISMFLNAFAAASGHSECAVNPLKIDAEAIRQLICAAAFLQEKLQEGQEGPEEPWMRG